MIDTSFKKTRVFLEMIKFEHSIFALPFAYLGLFLAEGGWPRPRLFFWVTVAMVSFRTMAMSLNRLIDREIDLANPRTQSRALPAKELAVPFVWAMAALSLVIFEASAFALGPLCFRLSPVPVILAWIYPWTKRFTWLSHAVLGMILGIAPCAAWLAAKGQIGSVPILIGLGVTTWVAGFDMIYALQDFEFDRARGLYSFPARFGVQACLKMTHLLHGLTLVAWVLAGRLAGRGFIFLFGVFVVAFLLLREHALARNLDPKALNQAFFTMNAVVSVCLFLATAADIFLGESV